MKLLMLLSLESKRFSLLITGGFVEEKLVSHILNGSLEDINVCISRVNVSLHELALILQLADLLLEFFDGLDLLFGSFSKKLIHTSFSTYHLFIFKKQRVSWEISVWLLNQLAIEVLDFKDKSFVLFFIERRLFLGVCNVFFKSLYCFCSWNIFFLKGLELILHKLTGL